MKSEEAHFGDVLQTFMKSKKRSDGKLADLSGVPKHTIVSWRQGRTKRPKYADQIFLVAQALELDEEEVNRLLASARHVTVSEHIQTIEEKIVADLSLSAEEAFLLLREASTEGGAPLDQIKAIVDPKTAAIVPLISYWLQRRAVQTPPSPSQTISLSAPFQAPRRVDHFTGRSALVADIHGFLTLSDKQIAILHGMGGVGKTAIATELAYELSDLFPDGVLWIDLSPLTGDQQEDEKIVKGVLIQLIRDFVPGFEENLELGQLSTKLREILNSYQFLMILDNGDEIEFLDSFLPASVSQTRVVITTRKRQLTLSHSGSFEINRLDEKHALTFLGRLIGEERVLIDAPAAKEMIDRLGGLPLAIQIVGKDLSQTSDLTIREYLELLEFESDRLVDDWEDATQSVRATFELSYRRLPDQLKSIFAAIAIFDGVDFSTDAVLNLLDTRPVHIKRGLARLYHLSLLERGRDGVEELGKRYRFHPLLKFFAREKFQSIQQQDPMLRSRLLAYYVKFLSTYQERIEVLDFEWENAAGILLWGLNQGETGPFLEGIDRLTVHQTGRLGYLDLRLKWEFAFNILEEALDNQALVSHMSEADRRRLQMKLGGFAYRLWQLNDAEKWLGRAQISPDYDIHTLSYEERVVQAYVSHFFARHALHQSQGSEVIKCYKAALDLFLTEEEQRSEEYVFFLIRYGEVLARSGQLVEAEASIQKGLDLLPSGKRSLPRLIGLMVLGILNYNQNRFDESLSLWTTGQEEAIDLQISGFDMHFLSNIAILKSERGEIGEASKIYQTLAASYLKLGDMEHHLYALANLAEDLIFLGKLNEAESTLREAIELALDYGISGCQLICLGNLALLHTVRRDVTQLRNTLRQIDTFSETITYQQYAAEYARYRAYLSLLNEEFELAESHWGESQADTEENSIDHVRNKRLHALISWSKGEQSEAIATLKDAVSIAVQEEFAYEEALSQQLLGEMSIQQGEDGQAYLDQAQLYFERVGVQRPTMLFTQFDT